MKARAALVAGAGALGLILLAAPAEANRSGIIARAQVGCGGGGCHSGGAMPAVELLGPSSVAPGGVADFVVRVSGGQMAAGVNIEASAGLLVPADGLAARAGQLVHAGDARPYTDGAAEFAFQWEAPDAPGQVDLFVAANSVDNNFQPTGDLWGLVASTIAVGDGVAPDAGPPPDGGAGGAGGGDGGGGGDSGCAQRPGVPPGGGALALLLFGGLALRRR